MNYPKPITFPMFAVPFTDERLSMAALGTLATIKAFRSFNLAIDDDFYHEYKGPVQELIKKGYLLQSLDFPFEEEPNKSVVVYDITDTPLEVREELSSKEYSKILSNAMGLTWDTKSFNVHHINHDRKDNRVDNLLLLPAKLHRKYHLLEQQTKNLRSEFSYEGIVKDISFHKKPLFAFIYTMSELEEMKKVQDNIIKTKAYCDANGKEFDGKDMFVAGNHEILQKYQ